VDCNILNKIMQYNVHYAALFVKGDTALIFEYFSLFVFIMRYFPVSC